LSIWWLLVVGLAATTRAVVEVRGGLEPEQALLSPQVQATPLLLAPEVLELLPQGILVVTETILFLVQLHLLAVVVAHELLRQVPEGLVVAVLIQTGAG
jgi:hypothetical protein